MLRPSYRAFAFVAFAILFLSRSALARTLSPSANDTNVDIVLEGADTATLRACADVLVAKLRAIDGVASADDGEREARAFLAPRLWLYLPLEELRAVREEVGERWDWEVAHQLGEELDDAPPPLIDRNHHVRDLRAWFEHGESDYFQSEDGSAVVVVVRTLADEKMIFERVRAVTADAHADVRFAKIRVGYAGRIPRDVDADHRHAMNRTTTEVLVIGAIAIAIALAARKVSRKGAAAYSVILVMCAGTSQIPAQHDSLDHPQVVASKILGSEDAPINFLPDDQEAKLPEIARINEYIAGARKHGVLAGANWEKFQRYVPPNDLRAITRADLPRSLVPIKNDGATISLFEAVRRHGSAL